MDSLNRAASQSKPADTGDHPPAAPHVDNRFVSSLTASYVVALIVLAVLSIGAFLVIARVVETESRFSVRLVENGRQLAAVVQASEAAHDLVHTDSESEREAKRSRLRELLDSIEARHNALIYGDEQSGTLPLRSAELRS